MPSAVVLTGAFKIMYDNINHLSLCRPEFYQLQNTFIFILFTSDCSLDTHSSSLDGPVSCHISSSCTAVDCCLSSEELGRTFRTTLKLYPCKNSLVIGIENYEFTLDLIDYNYGEVDHFWFKGVIRME